MNVIAKAALWAACFGLLPTLGLAQSVNTTLDGADVVPGDGTCATLGGDCTLRAALQEAMASGVAAVIDLPAGVYEWTLGELLIDQGDITVNGVGALSAIVDVAGNSRFLELDGNNTVVTLVGFEVRNAAGGMEPGGAIENDCDAFQLDGMCFRDCETSIGFGGAIHNRGVMTVEASVFTGCSAVAQNGGNGGGGGGGAMGGGGAISAWSGSTCSFVNCTFHDCDATGGNGGNAGGAGNGGQGGQSLPGTIGEGGDGGNVAGGNEDADPAEFGGGGGGGGYSTGWLGGNGDGTVGLGFGGNGGDGANNGAAGGGGGAAYGGAFFSRGGTHTFQHCTFSLNATYPGLAGNSIGGTNATDGIGRGGAIGTFAGNIFLDNCILYGNAATGAPSADEDIFLWSSGPIQSTDGYNIIGQLGDNAESQMDPTSVGNLIGVDPILLPFGNYGGTTEAFMLSACQPISPAIDAGVPSGVTEDQRGELRDASPDIGAIEGPPPVVLNPVVDQVCPGQTVQVSLTWPGAQTTWPDGSVGVDWTTGAITGGVATITTAEGCNEDIQIDVTEVAITVPDLGVDQAVCPGTVLVFDAGNPGAAFAWTLDGAPVGATQAYSLNQEGTLEVVVTVSGCQTSDAVQVDWLAQYPLDLGPDVTLCLGEDVTLDAEVSGWGGVPPAFAWQGGPNAATYTVNAAGTYTITATTTVGCLSTDEVQVVQSPLTTVDLGADQVICPGAPFVLDPGYPGAAILWQDGTTSSTYSVTNTGIYSVNVTLGDCQANDQVFIEVVSPFDAALPASTAFCTGDSVLLLAAFGASNYTWQNGATGNQLWASQPGIYEVTSVLDGCNFVDQVSVYDIPLPLFDFGLDVVLCEGESVVLDPGVPNADYVIFNESMTTPTLTVDEAGTYTAEVASGGCTFRDTVSVEVRPIPVFDLFADTVLCPGEVFTVATELDDDILVTWNTGQVGTSIDVNQPGTYTATSQLSGCQHVDSTVVDVSFPLTIPLATGYELCQGETLELDPTQGFGILPATYRWENGSPEPVRTINRSGSFVIEVANVCDTVEQVVDVKEVLCGCQIYVPTGFTPNNDGKNDAWAPVLDCEPYSYELTVWDRWGRPVFQSINPEEVWYAQVEGTPGSKTRESGKTFAIDGVYLWEVIIELRNDRIPEVIRQNGVLHVVR